MTSYYGSELALLLDAAKLYDEQFAKKLPFTWEINILTSHLEPSQIVLDVGCGTGRHIIPLAEKGLQVSGIDTNKEYMKAVHEKQRSKELNANLIIADVRYLPLQDSFFDTVICMGNVLGDIGITRKDRTTIIQEMLNTAKQETTIIIELVHRYWKPLDLIMWLHRYLATALRKLFGKPTEYGDYTENVKFDHQTVKLAFHAFTSGEAQQLFASRGLHTSIEKRAKFFTDWFILIATRSNPTNKVS
jgi:2-polyprenyl-3-methyl-5-hydroxy-6-metoxy-1,4-benzoquinol methylase